MTDKEAKRLSFEETYKKLHSAYLQRLENSLEAIDNIIAQKQLGPVKKEALQRASYLVHGLAGSGATFGFPEVSTDARKIDLFLEKILNTIATDQPINENDYETFEKMMYSLQETCRRALKSKIKKPAPNENNIPGTLHNNTGQKFTVLVVDDDENVSNLVSEKLKQRNIRVLTAHKGKSALAALAREIPHLIILDIMMPDITGHEVLLRIKQDPQFLKIPIIMLTGQAEQKDVVSALHAGAIDYLVKPVDLEQLATRVGKILDASRFEIVIADNDALLLRLMGNWFREKGFRVKLIEDGRKAWDYIVANTPNLVILDHMMPGLEGSEILKNMRKEHATKNIPIIVLSSRKQARDIEEMIKNGAQDYLIKPFIPDELVEKSFTLLKTTK